MNQTCDVCVCVGGGGVGGGGGGGWLEWKCEGVLGQECVPYHMQFKKEVSLT